MAAANPWLQMLAGNQPGQQPFPMAPGMGPLMPQATQGDINAVNQMAPPPANELDPKTGLPTYLNASTFKPLDTSRLRAVEEEMQKQGNAALDQQRAGVDQQRGMMQNYLSNNKPQLDLSPLLALADSQTGSNLSKGYTKPQTTQDLANQVMGMQGQIQKGTQGVSEQQMALLKDRLNSEGKLLEIEGQNQNKQIGLANTQAAFSHKLDEQNKAHIQHAQDKFTGDDTVKKSVGQDAMGSALIDKINSIKQLYQTNPGAAAASVKELSPMLVQLHVPQRISDKEVSLLGVQGGVGGFGAHLEAIIQQAKDGTIPMDQLDSVLSAVKVSQAHSQDELHKRAKFYAGQLRQNTNLSEDEALNKITNGAYSGKEDVVNWDTASPEEVKAAYKKKMGL